MNTLPRVFSAACFSLAAVGLSGQTVDFVLVSKRQRFDQVDNTTATPTASSWSFRANVEGDSISGIAAPTMTLPGGTGSTTFSYESGDDAWVVESDYTSQGLLDAAYFNGAYGITVLGQSVGPLNLSGNTFPPAPIASLSGGTISGGVLLWDPAQALTLTISGAGIDHMGVYISGNDYTDGTEDFGVVTLSWTIPADSLTAGTSYMVELGFDDIVGGTSPAAVNGTGGLSAAQFAAVYTAQTKFTIQAIPEPANYAAVAGLISLAGLMSRRRQART